MSGRVKTVRFGVKDDALLTWASGQDNFNAYVLDLIRLDMAARGEAPGPAPLDPRLIALLTDAVAARLGGIQAPSPTADGLSEEDLRGLF